MCSRPRRHQSDQRTDGNAWGAGRTPPRIDVSRSRDLPTPLVLPQVYRRSLLRNGILLGMFRAQRSARGTRRPNWVAACSLATATKMCSSPSDPLGTANGQRQGVGDRVGQAGALMLVADRDASDVDRANEQSRARKRASVATSSRSGQHSGPEIRGSPGPVFAMGAGLVPATAGTRRARDVPLRATTVSALD